MRYDNPVTISISQLELQIHQLINQERNNYGLMSLAMDRQISDIARNHSQDMSIRNFFSHQNPDGESPTDRAIRSGFMCRKDYGTYYREGLAENIFKASLYQSIAYSNGLPTYYWKNQNEIAISVVKGWMSSPGHRKNILTQTYDEEGIGVAVTLERYEVYITQNFC